jgi:hypothetical protein
MVDSHQKIGAPSYSALLKGGFDACGIGGADVCIDQGCWLSIGAAKCAPPKPFPSFQT